jgi:hypothetical protein
MVPRHFVCVRYPHEATFDQALLARNIKNRQLIHRADFIALKLLKKAPHKEKTSYLTWVQEGNALVTEIVSRLVTSSLGFLSAENQKR